MAPHKKKSHHSEMERLVTLAQRAHDIDFSPEEERLADLIARLVSRGLDHPIDRALDYLYAHDDLKAAERILFWAEDAASTMDILLSSDQEESRVGEITAFLVPLIFITPPSFMPPVSIPLPETLNQLARSFRQHHLIDAFPTLILLPELYRLQDLPTMWSTRHRWLQQLLAAATAQPYHLPTPSLESLGSNLSQHTVTIHLRFLVGAVIVDADEDSHRPLWDQEIPWGESETMWSGASDWQETVITLLQKVLPDIIVLPDLPDLWSDALTSSLNLWNHVVMDTAWDIFRHQSTAPLNEIVADIRWISQESAWSVTFVDPSRRSPPLLWMSPDDPSEQRQALLDALHDHGISRIQLNMQNL